MSQEFFKSKIVVLFLSEDSTGGFHSPLTRFDLHINTHRLYICHLTLLVFTRGGIETSPKYSKIRNITWCSVDLEAGVFDAKFGSEPYQVHNNQPPGGTNILYGATKSQSGLRVFHTFCCFYKRGLNP